jgi:hypothetical protein
MTLVMSLLFELFGSMTSLPLTHPSSLFLPIVRILNGCDITCAVCQRSQVGGGRVYREQGLLKRYGRQGGSASLRGCDCVFNVLTEMVKEVVRFSCVELLAAHPVLVHPTARSIDDVRHGGLCLRHVNICVLCSVYKSQRPLVSVKDATRKALLCINRQGFHNLVTISYCI